MVRVVLLSAAIWGTAIVGGSAWFGSRNAFAEYLNGKHILVHNHVYQLDQASLGELGLVRVEMINATKRPIQILGVSLSCDWMISDTLPQTIPSKSSLTLIVKVQQEAKSALPRQLHAEFLTNDPVQSRVPIQINTGD